MKTEIDFQSTNRFELSLGFVIATISLYLGYLSINLFVDLYYDPHSNVKLLLFLLSLIIFLIYFVQGIMLVKKGYNGLKESEGWEKKFRFEQMVNQILEQDLKLIDIQLKQMEYNEKVKSLKQIEEEIYNGILDLKLKKFRNIEQIVVQALDTNFYENTYPEIVKNIKKMGEENKKAGS